MMLQIKCRHLDVIPNDTCAFCNVSAPEPLADMCLQYIINHLDIICEYKPFTKKLTLKDNITLPVEICERILHAGLNKGGEVEESFLNIFRDRYATGLKRVKLKNDNLKDFDLLVLLEHRLVELEITNSPLLTVNSLSNIIKYASNLTSLTIFDCDNMFPDDYDYDYIITAPQLRKLCLRNVIAIPVQFYAMFLKYLDNLTYLELQCCSNLGDLCFVEHLNNLSTLILHNVNQIEPMIPAICKLTNLRHLDISQSRDDRGKYEDPNQTLALIIESLPRLVSLDISGTNLAGRRTVQQMTDGNTGACDIYGLSTRVKNPLQFLGLYETQYDACLRHDIPAKLIAANGNEQQVLVAAVAYLDRSDMLQRVLNELFHLFRFASCTYVGQALYLVLEGMRRHLMDRHIQISGSATLFYIVKGAGKELHEVGKVKKKVISTLLNGMSAHRTDDTMMRNGCLTLCQFKIPSDVLFEYERVVDILLHSVQDMQQESFVQRIGIYLLNSLACQVDGQQKVKLGELGAIDKMIWLIGNRLQRGLCDDVLEVAWSTMWNVTDETPSNCKKFLEIQGMEYFLSCLERFSDREELLRNMMGLLGNVAEVSDLRHYLMTPKYIRVFSNLLGSWSDGIEVSYNAAGVIAHIASDGPEVWTVEKPSRVYVLNQMVKAIDRWDLNSQRNINYRSFEPILCLVGVYHTPECQRWATWALANLTKVYPDKYCSLVESEGGLELLQELIDHPLPPFRVKELAAMVIENCRQFREQEEINSDFLLDG